MILESPEDTFFLSSRELAKRYEVDAATIVRTIQALGYRKFAEFVTDLRSHSSLESPHIRLCEQLRERRELRRPHSTWRGNGFAELAVFADNARSCRILALSKLVKRARRFWLSGLTWLRHSSWHLAYGLMHLGFPADAPLEARATCRGECGR